MNNINSLTPRTREITLLQGDDQAELDRLDGEVDRLKPQPGRTTVPPVTLDESDDYASAVEARNEFAKEAEERGVNVVIRALGRKTWREFVAKHPPRDDHAGDKVVGVNEDEFPDTLVPASLASPVFASDSEREAFLDCLTSAQFDLLYYTAFALNRTTGADPKDVRR